MTEKSDDPVRETVKDIDHTHPHTDQPFGSNGVYDRGPDDEDDADAEADGDERTGSNETDRDDERTGSSNDRTPTSDRGGTDDAAPSERGAQPVFDRGGKARDDR